MASLGARSERGGKKPCVNICWERDGRTSRHHGARGAPLQPQPRAHRAHPPVQAHRGDRPQRGGDPPRRRPVGSRHRRYARGGHGSRCHHGGGAGNRPCLAGGGDGPPRPGRTDGRAPPGTDRRRAGGAPQPSRPRRHRRRGGGRGPDAALRLPRGKPRPGADLPRQEQRPRRRHPGPPHTGRDPGALYGLHPVHPRRQRHQDGHEQHRRHLPPGRHSAQLGPHREHARGLRVLRRGDHPLRRP